MSGKLIVGLGNVGSEYDGTRHNAGFRVVDELSARAGAGSGITHGGEFRLVRDFQAYLCKSTLNGHNCILAKPTTYMNLSGNAVNAILRYFKIEMKDLIIIHDDVSLPLGRLRLQKAGGAGGQHGVESIIQSLGGAKEFDRLKIGVGPDTGGATRANFVLSRFPVADQPIFDKVVATCGDAVILWMSKGIESSMNKFNNVNLNPPPPAAQEG
jgi:PTH1 family peptidyl-tRNA hydrolase